MRRKRFSETSFTGTIDPNRGSDFGARFGSRNEGRENDMHCPMLGSRPGFWGHIWYPFWGP